MSVGANGSANGPQPNAANTIQNTHGSNEDSQEQNPFGPPAAMINSSSNNNLDNQSSGQAQQSGHGRRNMQRPNAQHLSSN